MARPTALEQALLDKTLDALAQQSAKALALKEMDDELTACLQRLDSSVDKWLIRRLEFIKRRVGELQRLETSEHGTLAQMEQALNQHLHEKDAREQDARAG